MYTKFFSLFTLSDDEQNRSKLAYIPVLYFQDTLMLIRVLFRHKMHLHHKNLQMKLMKSLARKVNC